jgi:DNA repair exonuclease SbcCD ATPase subunit
MPTETESSIFPPEQLRKLRDLTNYTERALRDLEALKRWGQDYRKLVQGMIEILEQTQRMFDEAEAACPFCGKKGEGDAATTD